MESDTNILSQHLKKIVLGTFIQGKRETSIQWPVARGKETQWPPMWTLKNHDVYVCVCVCVRARVREREREASNHNDLP
jgi:hypothetical protein